jgi:hypothetical protein
MADKMVKGSIIIYFKSLSRMEKILGGFTGFIIRSVFVMVRRLKIGCGEE